MGKKEKFKELWPDHSVKKICERLDITRQTASRWRRELELPYKRKPFTQEEDEFIKNHPDSFDREIAEKLNRPRGSISLRRIKLLGKKRKKAYEEELIELYLTRREKGEI